MQLTFPIIMISIIGIVAFSYMIERRSLRRSLQRRLHASFGQKPDRKEEAPDYKETAVYYNLLRRTLSEDELVDEITWEDLEMDLVFGRINQTVSCAGEQILYAWLHYLPRDKELLKKREKVIQYFAGHEKEREKAWLILHSLRKDSVNYYLPEYMEQLEFQGIPFVLFCKCLLCSLVLLILCALITGNPLARALAGINFFVNLAVYAFSKTKYEIQMEALYGIIRTVKTADAIFPLCQESFMEEEAQAVAESLGRLKSVSRMVLFLEQKKQARLSGDMIALAGDYLAGAFMWDFILYDRAVRLLLKRNENFLRLYRFAGEADACISVASFRKSMDFYCVPRFTKERILEAERLCHPLLEHGVANDFRLKKNVILTGSNASGKSTFVKAVVVNLILGQSIHTCVAEKMLMPDILVLTSMAVRDDVLSGESYYIREIRYLKRMIERSGRSRLVFCGIDEILRGTNTKERIAASLAVLTYLNKRNCILMTATHDLELAQELGGHFENYHFCESVEEGDVLFDYKLKKGISCTTNALRLLKAMNFPEEIVREARGKIAEAQGIAEEVQEEKGEV